MKNKSFSNGMDLPLGLAMAMAQNPQAFEYFAGLSAQQKSEIIGSAHSVHSKSEMQNLVNNMADGEVYRQNITF
ncbi:MAG: hypothetical protein ACI4I6_00065 [Hominimerdicola sp.]